MHGSLCPLQRGSVIFIFCCILCHSNAAALDLSVESEQDDTFVLSWSFAADVVHCMFSGRLSSFETHVWFVRSNVSAGVTKVLVLAFTVFDPGRSKNDLQPVREAVNDRGLFTAGWFGVREKHCSQLEIYDRLRASELQVPRLLCSTHTGHASVIFADYYWHSYLLPTSKCIRNRTQNTKRIHQLSLVMPSQ